MNKRYQLVGLFFACLLASCGGSTESAVVTVPDNNEPVVTPTPSIEPPASDAEYVGFESLAVRPVALSNDGKTVFVTNTPNHSLDIFRLDSDDKLVFVQSIKVGLEPVAVAVKDDSEVWVINHISDSASIVKLTNDGAYVARTLLLGDEPRDIVFAQNKAFITTAHRGQHRSHASLQNVPGAGDAELYESGADRADVWVFEADNLGTELGGKPVKIVTMFGDTPRPLAVANDGKTVYAAILNSGNQTSAVHESVMCYGFEDDDYGKHPCQTLDKITMPGGLADGWLAGGRPAPGVNKDGVPQPWTSTIVRYDNDSGQWRDAKGRNFTNGIRFTLPDLDVFAIDVATLNLTESFAHVGTTLFSMAVHPQTGALYVANTDANNATRFEGAGDFGGSTVQGHIAKSQLTRIDVTTRSVRKMHLNRHIDYDVLKASDAVKQHSVANPNQLIFSADGSLVYVAAMGSDKIAVYSSEAFENAANWDGQGSEFNPITAASRHIEVPGGPAGMALDSSANRLFVYTRFDNALSLINLQNKQQVQRLTMYSPEPDNMIAGRAMLYDAKRSSSNGEASCASCHIGGDTDHLSWNLGNPDSGNGANPQPFPTSNLSRLGCDLVGPNEPSCELLQIINGNGDELSFASMKGPMATQSMRGMSTHGHLHWRGDRSVGYFGDDTAQTLNEKVSFKNFIVAFEGLLGLDIDLPVNVTASNKSTEVVALEQDIDAFADFMLQVRMPPNPIRALDNRLSTSAQVGFDFFNGNRRSDGLALDTPVNGDSVDGVNCAGCHNLDPLNGFYGTNGQVAHGGEIQIFKVPQLRNLYTKVGMFGLPDRAGFLPSKTKTNQGPQVRGFGFLHDGATDLLQNFLRGGVFDDGEEPCSDGLDPIHGCEFNLGFVGIPGDVVRTAIVDYLMAFDADLAPIVGQQITLSSTSSAQMFDRLGLFEARAQADFASKILGGQSKECELVANGVVDRQKRGYFYDVSQSVYISDKATQAPLTRPQMIALLRQTDVSMTFTCMVPGSGWQHSVDADLNGTLNGDEI